MYLIYCNKNCIALNWLCVSYILIPSLDPFLEEHVPLGKGLTAAICSRMAIFVSRHERVTFITFLLPYDSNLMRNEFVVESMSWPSSLTYRSNYF